MEEYDETFTRVPKRLPSIRGRRLSDSYSELLQLLNSLISLAISARTPHGSDMQGHPLALESFAIIGEELAIRWKDGVETYIRLEDLRRWCPCAVCAGEKDLLGRQYGGSPTLSPNSFVLKSCAPVGGYALQPVWADGHSSGIFSYEYLRSLYTGE